MDFFQTAVSLMVKSLVLGARWAGGHRLRYLRWAAQAPGQLAELESEVAFLRDQIACLASENELLKARLAKARPRRRYSWQEWLKILWHMEYFGIARRRVSDHF